MNYARIYLQRVFHTNADNFLKWIYGKIDAVNSTQLDIMDVCADTDYVLINKSNLYITTL